jgi:DNA replication protein DnaC
MTTAAIFLSQYEKVASGCARNGIYHPRSLLRLAALELIERERRMTDQQIRAAKFPAIKTLDSFDFMAIPALNKMLLLGLARCEYIERRENVIALGPSGTGKSRLALALGLAAGQRGLTTGLVTAAGLVHQLMEARDEKRLLKLQALLAGLKLLIIDELCYVPLSLTRSELLFEVLSQRYECGSTIVTSNLPTDEPLDAAAFMAATAEQSTRCSNPAYRAISSWHPDEHPLPNIMQDVALDAIDLMGLTEYQALIMGHGDTVHKHLHTMLNRVHPKTSKACSTAPDYQRFDRLMKLLSEQYGFMCVPSHAFNSKTTIDKRKKPKEAAHYAAKRGASTNRLQWSRRDARGLANLLSENLDQASRISDIAVALADLGLTLEPNAKGYVAGNPDSYVKLLALGLTASAKSHAKRRAPKRAAAGRPTTAKRKGSGRTMFTVDELDNARVLGSRADYRATIEQSKAARKLRFGRVPVLAQMMEELRQTLRGTTALTGC